MNKEISKLIRQLKGQEWKVEFGGKHIRATSPVTNKKVFISVSPSDYRGHKNLMSKLRREGFKDE